jgi:hypothetical protein
MKNACAAVKMLASSAKIARIMEGFFYVVGS